MFDLLELLANWTENEPPGVPGEVPGDIVGTPSGPLDGVVNVFDLLMMLANWGTCGIGGGTLIQTEQDCFNKFYPDHMEALNSCLDAVAATQ